MERRAAVMFELFPEMETINCVVFQASGLVRLRTDNVGSTSALVRILWHFYILVYGKQL